MKSSVNSCTHIRKSCFWYPKQLSDLAFDIRETVWITYDASPKVNIESHCYGLGSVAMIMIWTVNISNWNKNWILIYFIQIICFVLFCFLFCFCFLFFVFLFCFLIVWCFICYYIWFTLSLYKRFNWAWIPIIDNLDHCTHWHTNVLKIFYRFRYTKFLRHKQKICL